MSWSPDGSRERRRATVSARRVTYLVVAALAAAAIWFTPPAPSSAERSLLRVPAGPPHLLLKRDSLVRGESLGSLLARAGLGEEIVRGTVGSLRALDPRRLPAGMPVTVRQFEADSVPAEIILRLASDHLVYLTRTDSVWTAREEKLPWTTDTVVYSGEINATLYGALDRAAEGLPKRERAELAWKLADILEYRVDMSRDLQAGDRFRVLVERSVDPEGTARVTSILAASFDLSNGRVEAIRHVAGGRASYYDAEGKSLQAAFLRAPLAFRRISSVFGMRRHPILGVWRAHKGTDYAASSGTPVRSVGDGTVIFSGRKSGYGNVLEVRHRNGYVSRYAHLRGFARGVRRGASVGIGQTIGFVGMTGLATAPHLHFEVLVGGVHRNPRVALAAKGGWALESRERDGFRRAREQLIAMLDRRASTPQVAVAGE